MPAPTDLRDEMQTALKAARDICDAVDGEGRDFSAEEREQVTKALSDARAAKAKIAERDGDSELRKALADLGDGVDLVSGGKSAEPVPPAAGGTIGERFVHAPEFKGWLERIAPDGRIPDSAKGLISPPVQLKSLFKAPVTGASDTSSGAFVNTDFTGIYESLGRRPFTIRDIISTRQTTSDTVEFVRQTTASNAATPVAEATATAGASGTKPESSVAYEKVTATVKTIAVWVPATKRALSDAAQIRGLIDQELRDDLTQELEDQIVNGDGTGENFTGLSNTANVQAQAWDTDLLTTTRKARTKVRVTGRAMATAYLLHPNDWERIDLTKDSEARYYFGGPQVLGTPRLWGLPVVESEAVTEGVGYVGDFNKAVLWDREQATIQVSDSHSDFFIRNMVAILAEMRAAFGVIRPTAFVEMDLTAV